MRAPPPAAAAAALLLAAAIFFSAGPHVAHAQATRSDCPMGQYGTAQNTCVACPAGTFSTTPNATSATVCTACSRTSYSSSAGSTSCTPCPSPDQGTLIASATSVSQCSLIVDLPQGSSSCPAGTFTFDATRCIQCPGGTASSATGAANVLTCATCNAGTYAVAGSDSCTPCPKGAYNTQSGSSSCQSCIPGTYAASTGSSSADACIPCPVGTYAPLSQSANCTVCPRKTNATKPGSFACSECATGYSTRPNGGTECWRININQCSLNPDGSPSTACHRSAICTDMDDGVTDSAMYSCSCPPGMLGDGVSDCAVYEYETKFVVTVSTTETVETFNVTAFKLTLYQTGVIAASIPEYRVVILVSAATTSTSGARRLLQSGSGIDVGVSVMSSSEEEQQAVTSTVNTTALTSVPGVTAVSPVSSAPPDQFLPTATESPGFSVDSVQFDDSTARWNIDVSYTPSVPNTITSLYISKPGTVLPIPQVALDTYLPSMHPCALSSSICCLADYQSRYIVGAISANFSTVLGNSTCDPLAETRETLGMFSTAGNAYAVDNALSEYPDSSIVRISSTQVRLRIAHTDLVSNGLAIRTATETNPAGYELSFFVGMTFMTMLPANALGVVVSQYAIKLAVVNSVTFSFASQKDFTMLRYVMLSVIQNKWIDGLIERRLQIVQMGVVLPFGTQQNMATGLIPLTSVRFAISQTLPDRNNASQWVNPCFSSDNTGMYDRGQGYYNMYNSAAQQTCAARYALCTNPNAVLTSNLVNFFFPIGDRTLNDAIYAAASTSTPYNIYVTFQISVIDSSGQSQIMSLFATAPIRSNQVSRQCESVTATGSLLDTTAVDVAVGFVGTQSAWDSTMVLYRNVLQATRSQGSLLDSTAQNVTAKTIPMGMVTIVVKGSPTIFSKAPAANYFIDVEQLATMHFLDAGAFSRAIGMIRAGTAYTMIVGNGDGRPRMEFTTAFSRICGATGLSCVINTNIFARQVLKAGQAHPLSTGFGTTSQGATRDWLMQNILRATDEYSRDLSTNMTTLVRSNFGIDDRVQKAWFVNAAVRWSVPGVEGTQSELLMADKLIVFAVITLNDRQGNVLRRRLLSISQDVVMGGPSKMLLHDDILDGGTDVISKSLKSVPKGRSLLQIGSPPPSVVPANVVPVSVVAPSVADDDPEFLQALRRLASGEREGTFPPIVYQVNVPEIAASAYGIETGDGENKTFSVALRINLIGRFDDLAVAEGLTSEQIGSEFYRRLAENKDMFCPDCKAVLPLFNNILTGVPIDTSILEGQTGGAQVEATPIGSRRLLQQQQQQGSSTSTPAPLTYTAQSNLAGGTYSVLLVYDSWVSPKNIYFVDIAKSVYGTTYAKTLDVSSPDYNVLKLMNAHFILNNMDFAATGNLKDYTTNLDRTSPGLFGTAPSPGQTPNYWAKQSNKFDTEAFSTDWDLKLLKEMDPKLLSPSELELASRTSGSPRHVPSSFSLFLCGLGATLGLRMLFPAA